MSSNSKSVTLSEFDTHQVFPDSSIPKAIVDLSVTNDNLVIAHQDGTTVDLGNYKGPTGDYPDKGSINNTTGNITFGMHSGRSVSKDLFALQDRAASVGTTVLPHRYGIFDGFIQNGFEWNWDETKSVDGHHYLVPKYNREGVPGETAKTVTMPYGLEITCENFWSSNYSLAKTLTRDLADSADGILSDSGQPLVVVYKFPAPFAMTGFELQGLRADYPLLGAAVDVSDDGVTWRTIWTRNFGSDIMTPKRYTTAVFKTQYVRVRSVDTANACGIGYFNVLTPSVFGGYRFKAFNFDSTRFLVAETPQGLKVNSIASVVKTVEHYKGRQDIGYTVANNPTLNFESPTRVVTDEGVIITCTTPYSSSYPIKEILNRQSTTNGDGFLSKTGGSAPNVTFEFPEEIDFIGIEAKRLRDDSWKQTEYIVEYLDKAGKWHEWSKGSLGPDVFEVIKTNPVKTRAIRWRNPNGSWVSLGFLNILQNHFTVSNQLNKGGYFRASRSYKANEWVYQGIVRPSPFRFNKVQDDSIGVVQRGVQMFLPKGTYQYRITASLNSYGSIFYLGNMGKGYTVNTIHPILPCYGEWSGVMASYDGQFSVLDPEVPVVAYAGKQDQRTEEVSIPGEVERYVLEIWRVDPLTLVDIDNTWVEGASGKPTADMQRAKAQLLYCNKEKDVFTSTDGAPINIGESYYEMMFYCPTAFRVWSKRPTTAFVNSNNSGDFIFDKLTTVRQPMNDSWNQLTTYNGNWELASIDLPPGLYHWKIPNYNVNETHVQWFLEQRVAQPDMGKLFVPVIALQTTLITDAMTVEYNGQWDNGRNVWYNAIDGNPNTNWGTLGVPSEANPQWMSFKFHKEYTIEKFHLNSLGWVTKFTLQGRNSDTDTWTDIQTYEHADRNAALAQVDYRITHPASYSQYRIWMTGSTAGSYAYVTEFQMYHDTSNHFFI